MNRQLAIVSLLLAFFGLTACKTTCPEQKSGGATGGSSGQELPQAQPDPDDGLPRATTSQISQPEATTGQATTQ